MSSKEYVYNTPGKFLRYVDSPTLHLSGLKRLFKEHNRIQNRFKIYSRQKELNKKESKRLKKYKNREYMLYVNDLLNDTGRNKNEKLAAQGLLKLQQFSKRKSKKKFLKNKKKTKKFTRKYSFGFGSNEHCENIFDFIKDNFSQSETIDNNYIVKFQRSINTVIECLRTTHGQVARLKRDSGILSFIFTTIGQISSFIRNNPTLYSPRKIAIWKRWVKSVLPEIWYMLAVGEIKHLQAQNQEKFQEGDTCVICDELLNKKYERVYLTCDHKFHIKCIGKWVIQQTRDQRQPSCPLCRAVIT